MAKTPVSLTEKEARELGGNNLIVPDTAKAVEVKAEWAQAEDPVPMIYTWDEVCIVDEVKWDGDPVKPGTQEPSEFSDLDHERFNIRLRVSQFDPSDNQGRVLTDFNDFVMGLRHKNVKELEELADVAPKGSRESVLLFRLWDLQRNCRKMAGFFAATGHADRLAGKGKARYFQGFSSVLDVLPQVFGKKVVATIRQKPLETGGSRDEVIGYKLAE